jgi:anti-sigma regulatory factor (Ser/Thr protein kinase)
MMSAPDRPGRGRADSAGVDRSIVARERAIPHAVPTLRRRAGDFAATHGAAREVVERVELAVSEAVTNAVKYAYVPGGEGPVELTASAAGEWIEITVRDQGAGFQAGESDGLGIGLELVAQMSVDLRIEQTPHGTTVAMRFPLAGPAEQA